MRLSLRNCGLIDPEDIEEYIANEGYQALAKCLFEMKPETVVQEVLNSGLCGRGGAGFPTGLKWKIAAGVKKKKKYVICNADEGGNTNQTNRELVSKLLAYCTYTTI